ncbi:MAG TPA: hypothetical protein VJ725_16390 [Thermoanaerobaculia bacterium]|nr:hypothetical protein [Thermoanaerobaculia bacterium]
MRQAARVALGLLVAALAVPALQATTAVERTETDLIQEAEIIVVGRVAEVRSTWVDNDLVTLATVNVSETLKGAPGSQVTVVLPGGVDLNRKIPVAMTFPAAPELMTKENVLLFLTAEGRIVDGYSVVGFSQGKFSVVENANGEKIATQNLSELTLQGRDGNTRQGGAKTISLPQLRQKVQSLGVAKPR